MSYSRAGLGLITTVPAGTPGSAAFDPGTDAALHAGKFAQGQAFSAATATTTPSTPQDPVAAGVAAMMAAASRYTVMNAPTPLMQPLSPAVAQAMTAAQAPFLAYQGGLNALNTQGWPALPLGPYPPAGDTSSFPRTGDPSLVVNPAMITRAQLAEPGKVTLGIAQCAAAAEPQLNTLFFVGCACLAGYFLLRR